MKNRKKKKCQLRYICTVVQLLIYMYIYICTVKKSRHNNYRVSNVQLKSILFFH